MSGQNKPGQIQDQTKDWAWATSTKNYKLVLNKDFKPCVTVIPALSKPCPPIFFSTIVRAKQNRSLLSVRHVLHAFFSLSIISSRLWVKFQACLTFGSSSAPRVQFIIFITLQKKNSCVFLVSPVQVCSLTEHLKFFYSAMQRLLGLLTMIQTFMVSVNMQFIWLGLLVIFLWVIVTKIQAFLFWQTFFSVIFACTAWNYEI